MTEINQQQQPTERGPWLWHMRRERSDFVVRRREREPQCADGQAHRETCAADPVLYALSAVDERVGRAQRARVLFTLLASSRKGLGITERQMLDRVVRWLLTVLPAPKVLEVFVALRKVRANHKHTARAVLRYVLNHPSLESMAKARRPTVLEVLEHALGRDTFRGRAKQLIAGEEGGAGDARRHLLRWSEDVARTQAVVKAMFGASVSESTSADTTAYERTHEAFAPAAVERAAPKTVTATNRGAIASHLVHLYRGGASAELEAAVESDVAEAAALMPQFQGRVAMVLDVSASTRGYGEREFCCVAQSLALKMVLGRCCDDLRVVQVGDGEAFSSLGLPQPSGTTDLACAVLDAVAQAPDVVLVVTDGYENQLEGDLGAVLAALPGVGVHVPVVMCHSMFTHKDDLSLRRPVSGWPELSFWHQDDFFGVISGLFSIAAGEVGRQFLRQTLTKRLSELEAANPSWLKF